MIHRLIMLLVVALALPFMGVGGSLAHAQGQDPTLAAMILLYTQKAKSELKQQEAMMLLESTGHIWITEEVNATTDLQKQFNKYLDSFHGIIMYAAQIYGFYHEIDHLVTNLGAFNDQLSAHPSNALAVALSSNRNKIYREIIMNSVDIVSDVRQVCLSDTKMTEKERMEIIFGIRPKLKLMNKKLQRLTKAGKGNPHNLWAAKAESARIPVPTPSKNLQIQRLPPKNSLYQILMPMKIPEIIFHFLSYIYILSKNNILYETDLSVPFYAKRGAPETPFLLRLCA